MIVMSKLEMEEYRPIVSWSDCRGEIASFTTGEKFLELKSWSKERTGMLELSDSVIMCRDIFYFILC